MEIASTDDKKGVVSGMRDRFKSLMGKLWAEAVELAKMTKKLGDDDPRRIVHAMKVGIAITLVSLFYYFEPLYDGFGASAMWAVISVVVVFEFHVGATLGRGINRGLGTFFAGGLGFGAHHLADQSGQIEPVLLGLFVFLLATGVTFIRFFPRIKARYDYGLLIFILTFCLISVSGYRDHEILDMAHKRVSTILIGGFTALFVCIFVCPAWAGDDLHNLIANNIEKLGKFLEGFGDECLQNSGHGDKKETCSQDYKTVLNSKQSEESLANFARWEPCHGPFRFRHPWKQYLKIGSLTRQCAYKIEALSDHLNVDFQSLPGIFVEIREACIKMSLESGNALKELASAIKTMTPPDSASTHIAKSNNAANNLKSLLKTGICNVDINILDIVPAATMASLLVDIASSTEQIAESIQELASRAKFKNVEPNVPLGKQKSHPKKTKQSSFEENAPNHCVVEIDQKVSQSSRGNEEKPKQTSNKNNVADHVITIDHDSLCLPENEKSQTC